MYADRRWVGAAHFAPGLGQRPMFRRVRPHDY
jgi:hypothetical protein